MDFIKDVKDDTKSFNKKDIESGKVMAILSYIIPLIPFLVETKNKYVVYHAKNGMNLLIISISYGIVNGVLSSLIKVDTNCGFGHLSDIAISLGRCTVTPWWVTAPLSLIGCGITILFIIGIINVCQGKAKELPLVNKIKIIK